MKLETFLAIALAIFVPVLLAWAGSTIKMLKTQSKMTGALEQISKQLDKQNGRLDKLEGVMPHHIETYHRGDK